MENFDRIYYFSFFHFLPIRFRIAAMMDFAFVDPPSSIASKQIVRLGWSPGMRLIAEQRRRIFALPSGADSVDKTPGKFYFVAAGEERHISVQGIEQQPFIRFRNGFFTERILKVKSIEPALSAFPDPELCDEMQMYSLVGLYAMLRRLVNSSVLPACISRICVGGRRN